jgi:hypothetical protein
MIVLTMGRSHRPASPRRRTSLLQPIPLRLPLDRPSREPPAREIHHDEDEIDHGSGPPRDFDDADEVGGKHVIVIDLA